MAKVLNLDGLTKKIRSVTVGGVNHDVKEMTVADFIATSAEAKRLASVTDPVEQMEATISLINRAIPSLDKSVLENQTIENLMVISRFIQGAMDDDTDNVTDDGADGKK